MKHFRIEFEHLWDRTHFKNKRIVSELSDVVCGFPKLRCYQPCSDCQKRNLASIGKIVVKNYEPGVVYSNGESFPEGKIKVEILIHCPENKADLVDELIQLIMGKIDKIISYQLSESEAPLF